MNVMFRMILRKKKLMVARALGLSDPESINVAKLVSKWKSHLNLDFISFKVLLPTELKLRALTPTTWPRNVRYRECIRRNNTWKPSKSFVTNFSVCSAN